MKTLRFSVLEGTFTIHQLKPGAGIPKGLSACPFYSLSGSGEELSLVAPEMFSVESKKSEPGWSCLKVIGPLAFNEIGILAGIAANLAAAGISIFAVSTFATDYILVKEVQLKTAKDALAAAGHKFARVTRAAIAEERTSPTINAYAALLEKQIPLIKSLLNEKIGPTVQATLRSQAAWAAVIGGMYEFLPAPIRLVVNRDIFIAYCLRNLDKILPEAPQLKTKNKKAK